MGRECRGLVVTQWPEALSEKGRALLRELAPATLRVETRTEWPGTTLYAGRTAQVTLFRLHPDVVDNLLRYTDGRLFAWLPPLPEDLCILTAEETPWLTTIAHEKDAFLKGSPESLLRLIDAVPGLKKAVRLGRDERPLPDLDG